MMRKFTMATVMLFVATAAVAGPGCYGTHDQQVMSCAEGSVWDVESQSCVPQITS